MSDRVILKIEEMEKPWQDEEVLYELYVSRDMTMSEIAQKLGCSTGLISMYISETDIEVHMGNPDAKYRDEETLREMYLEKGMSCSRIGEKLGCCHATVHDWLNRYGIETRNSEDGMTRGARWTPTTFYTSDSGHEYWQWGYKGEHYVVSVHRLLAVSEYGLDAIRDKVVHHRNWIPWDNRAENIELVDRSEHMKIHAYSEPEEGFDG